MSDNATANQTPLIEARGLSFQYPGSTSPALQGLDLSVHRGERFGLLGPNGSGKSTLFKLLATLLQPTGDGELRAWGLALPEDAAAVRSGLGVVFQSPSLDDQLSVRENLITHARLYGLSTREAERRASTWAERLEITDRLDHRVHTLSGGLKRRAELAKALLTEPTALLMDEPTTGLDPAARGRLWDTLDQLHSETELTVLLTTHLMDEAERCERLALMHEGRCVALGTPAELVADLGGHAARVLPAASHDAEALSADIAEAFGPFGADEAPRAMRGEVRFAAEHATRLIQDIHERWPDRVREIAVGRPTLDDVFLYRTGASLATET